MDDCIFCKLSGGIIPTDPVYEDELIFALKDANPQAPVHILFMPKEHIESADGINGGNSAAVARIFEVIPKVAVSLGITDSYRVITNCGTSAGQSVRHLHFHLISGARELAERII